MKSIPCVIALCFCAQAAAAAECVGQNLIGALPEADQAWIEARVEDLPNREGILWQASKGDAKMVLVGTYHFNHPAHAQTLARIAQDVAEADRLLVELGPEEEEKLKTAMTSDPGLLMDIEGPTLPERLEPEIWAELGDAMEARGVPAIMASRMRPWYVATLLGMSPCIMAEVAAAGGQTSGLDWQIMGLAAGADIPIEALEPWDTVLKMFGGLTPDEEIALIRYSLPAASYADDYTVTLADAYQAEDVWPIWEFSRLDGYRNSGLPEAEVDAMLDEAEELLINARNRSWIGPLTRAAEDAAADGGKGIVAAFGALHLPGDQGVLRLLENDGWQVERIE